MITHILILYLPYNLFGGLCDLVTLEPGNPSDGPRARARMDYRRAAEKGAREESVTPRVSRRGVGAASGADHRPGIAPATDDKQPGLPADPPRGPTGNPEATP
jgi:hypothetical protein